MIPTSNKSHTNVILVHFRNLVHNLLDLVLDLIGVFSHASSAVQEEDNVHILVLVQQLPQYRLFPPEHLHCVIPSDFCLFNSNLLFHSTQVVPCSGAGLHLGQLLLSLCQPLSPSCACPPVQLPPNPGQLPLGVGKSFPAAYGNCP